MRIAATDVDAGENARITYSWDPSSGMDADFFDLDRVTGIVHLKKKITVRAPRRSSIEPRRRC